MFKNYLKIAFRNLWRNRGYNLVNILVMALGFAAFLLIMGYINYERSYDKVYPDHKNIVKVRLNNGQESGSTLSAGFGPRAARQFPEIKRYTRMNFFISKGLCTVGEKSNYVNNLYSVDSSFFSVFQYTFLYGNPGHALDKPNSIVISEAISRQFFGDRNPVGENISINRKYDYTVTGVFRKFNSPTTFHADAFVKLDTHGRETQLFPMNYYTFFRLQKHTNIAALRQKLTSFIRHWAKGINPKAGFDVVNISLDPISRMHFSDIPGSIEVGHPALLAMLLIIGVTLLFIAAVNFINLAVTTAMGRAKEVAMRKVMGARKNNLTRQFYLETFLQVFMAFVLAILFAEIFKPAYAHFLGLNTLANTAGMRNMIFYAVTTLVLVTFIAGAYPAFYLSHFNPSRVLKGSFSRSKSGTFTQRLLLVFQITLTTIFLVGIMVMIRQVSYLKKINLGFQPDQVLTLSTHVSETYEKYGSLKAQLRSVPGISSVSRVDNLPNGHGFGGNGYQYKDIEKDINFLCVDYDFIKTMGMHLMDGRTFDPGRDPDTLRHIILNEAAVKALGIMGDPIGQYLNKGYGGTGKQIIGVVKNFHYGALQNRIQPLIFELHQGNLMSHVLIRVRTKNLDQTLASIRTIWQNFEPGFPITYTFLDGYFAKFLKSFERQEKTVFVFALLAVLLSLFGLFALVAFSVRNRRKEVAVRKVLGANNGAILALLNRNFIWLVIGGSVLGWPLAYLAVRHWLNGFAYRINMPVWPFIVAAAFSILLTIITVSLVSLRAARSNPVEALKYE